MIDDSRYRRLCDQVVNSDTLREQLISYRGGCSCHLSPPCSVCCEPVTEDELEWLGLLPDDACPVPDGPTLADNREA